MRHAVKYMVVTLVEHDWRLTERLETELYVANASPVCETIQSWAKIVHSLSQPLCV